MRSASGYGSGRKSTPLMTLKNGRVRADAEAQREDEREGEPGTRVRSGTRCGCR